MITNLLISAGLAIFGIWAIYRSLRAAIHHDRALADTQPGHDQTALNTCQAIWNTEPRKEKP
ncbi:hypothetical protein [Streptomyces cadmiisoli]|uniref:hypothetical protein n=1 Tax=Streptomyces cadmiisoli TaxID=2184053 RepID=UPI003648FA29